MGHLPPPGPDDTGPPSDPGSGRELVNEPRVEGEQELVVLATDERQLPAPRLAEQPQGRRLERHPVNVDLDASHKPRRALDLDDYVLTQTRPCFVQARIPAIDKL